MINSIGMMLYPDEFDEDNDKPLAGQDEIERVPDLKLYDPQSWAKVTTFDDLEGR